MKVIVGDATTYELPEDVTVLFFWNPFSGSVLNAVIGQIRASLNRRSRRMRILYVRCREQPDAFAACDWLTPVCALPTWPSPAPTELILYETRGECE